MALDLTLPASGITKHSDFYRVMRDNFNGIYNKYTPTKYDVSLLPTVTQVATDPVFYYVDSAGYVHLFGSVVVNSSMDRGCEFFVLPEGHRPEHPLNFKSYIYYTPPAPGGSGIGILEIYAYDHATYPGMVRSFIAFAAGTYCTTTFNGIVFKGV
jgi:hypothetical protein